MDVMELQQRYPAAFMDGVKAYLRQKTVDDNPHSRPCSPTVRTEYHAWEAGFINMLPKENYDEQ